MNKTTCQICARDIKANTGIIAHHGYQRPGTGWQTASCDGAKQLPYEVSRDFIPIVIGRYQVHAKNQEDMADNMLRNPSATITRHYISGHTGKELSTEDFAKPEDFDPYAVVNLSPRAFTFKPYENEFSKQYLAHRNNVKEIEAAIAYLQERYNNWKPKEAN